MAKKKQPRRPAPSRTGRASRAARPPRPPARAAQTDAALRWAVLAILAVAAALLLAALTNRLLYEIAGPYRKDSFLFWTVGRGILNGLIPYRDLFEDKPPAIFLLSALSFAIRGDHLIGSYAQAAVIAGVVAVVTAIAVRRSAGMDRLARATLALMAVIFSTALALYIADRSGQFQVESFGSFFILAYAAVIAWDDRRWGWPRICLAGAMIGIGGAFKEPFLLIAVACALLLAETPRALVRTLLLPLLVAGAVGGAAMGAAGYLWPYLRIDLHFLVFDLATRHGSPWVRGLDVLRPLRDVDRFSSLLSSLLLLAGAAGLAAWLRPRARLLWRSAACIAGVYFLSTAVGATGAYYDHHFIFAAAGYAALFFLLLKTLGTPGTLVDVRIAAAAAAALCLAYSGSFPAFPASSPEVLHAELRRQQRVADAIDAILDRCGLDRYAFIGTFGPKPFALTRHSPQGPLFIQIGTIATHKDLQARFLRELPSVELAVKDDWGTTPFNDAVKDQVLEHFSTKPWSCAKGVDAASFAPAYTFYYREGGGRAPRGKPAKQ